MPVKLEDDDEEFVDELGESVVIDNTSEMTGAGFSNSTKQLIMTNFVSVFP